MRFGLETLFLHSRGRCTGQFVLKSYCKIGYAENNTIAHLYDASGTKRARQTKADASPLDQTNYIANFVYENNQLQFILTSEGRIMMQNEGTYEYQYFLKDHLGNTRITMNQNGTVLQEDAYYPFGMNIAGLSYSNASPENKYKYNGKRCTERSRSELEGEFGLDWYDYDFRYYDPAIARWHVIDPLAEKFYYATPYGYALNNPIKFADIDGRDVNIAYSSRRCWWAWSYVSSYTGWEWRLALYDIWKCRSSCRHVAVNNIRSSGRYGSLTSGYKR